MSNSTKRIKFQEETPLLRQRWEYDVTELAKAVAEQLTVLPKERPSYPDWDFPPFWQWVERGLVILKRGDPEKELPTLRKNL